MNAKNDNTVLKVTRILVNGLLVGVVIGGAMLVIGAVVLPYYWTDVVADVAKSRPTANTTGLMPSILALMAFAIVVLGIVWTVLRKLQTIIATVQDGDPFVHANAARLKAIGWLLVTIQVIGLPLGRLVEHIGKRLQESDMQSEFSISGILAILLVFVLAGVFERGTTMRDELEGTV
jgi:hypothetical protein